MGQGITKIYSLAMREVKMYNIERRAEKVISKDKPSPAPMLESTVKELERLKNENVSTDYLHKKSEDLDQYLKKVYVTTPDPVPPMKRIHNPMRPLPLKRNHNDEMSYGYSESEEATVPAGRASLKQALQFIIDHQVDPVVHDKSAISAQYKLDITTTGDILEHFKMFKLHVKKKEKDPAALSKYQQLQLRVKNMTFVDGPSVMEEVKAEMEKKAAAIEEAETIKRLKVDPSLNTFDSKKAETDQVNMTSSEVDQITHLSSNNVDNKIEPEHLKNDGSLKIDRTTNKKVTENG